MDYSQLLEMYALSKVEFAFRIGKNLKIRDSSKDTTKPVHYPSKQFPIFILYLEKQREFVSIVEETILKVINFVWGGVWGVTVIVKGSGLGYSSSNRRRGCLHFTYRLYPWEKYSPSSYGYAVEQTGFFKICMATDLEEGKLNSTQL